MSKQIVFAIADNGVDGWAPTKFVYASFSEAARDKKFEADKAKAWRWRVDLVVDTGLAEVQALAKLSAVDKLILGLTG